MDSRLRENAETRRIQSNLRPGQTQLNSLHTERIHCTGNWNHVLCNKGTTLVGPQIGKANRVGFSPCIRHRPAIGKGDAARLAGAKALIIYGFRGVPTKVVPLLQDRSWKAIQVI